MNTRLVPSARRGRWRRAGGRVSSRWGQPSWSRPGLIVVVAVAGSLVFWSLTANGYANNWYAGGVLAASRSWKALFENAADLSGVVSIDKGPLSQWMMGIAARILGFGPFGMLLPDALCGLASVILLYDTVRRTLGQRAALVAALVLAVSPVSVAMDRYNDPESLLALLLVASAWALVRALESGRLRHVLICGGLVGLAFNTKMLEAYLVVPGLVIAFAVSGHGERRRRLGHLVAAGGVMITVSFAWFTVMTLIPAGDRPFVSGTTDNSWFSLIFGFNGLSRLTGGGAAGLTTGPLRLLSGSAVGGQVGWLLPFALAALLAGVWATRRAPREDRRRAAYLLFGTWCLAAFVVFSFARGTFLPYYTSAMAPAVAALIGGGAVAMFDRFPHRWGWTAALSAAVAGTALVSFQLLLDTPSFVPWLRWVVVASAGSAVSAVIVARVLWLRPLRHRRWGWSRSDRFAAGVAAAAIAITVLAGPAAYAVATVGYGQTGGDPAAGPAPGRGATRAAAALNTPNPVLVAYLRANRDGARFLVAANGSQATAPIALATGAPVITLGGFSESGTSGSAPAPTVGQLAGFVARGELRYVIPGPRGYAPTRTRWLEAHCRAVTIPGMRRMIGGVYLCRPANLTR